MRVISYFPYESGMVSGRLFAAEMTPAFEELRKELSAQAGHRPDNKTSFQVETEGGEEIGIQFWDWTVTFCKSIVPRPGRTWHTSDADGHWTATVTG